MQARDWWTCKMVHLLWKILVVLQKVKKELPQEPSIPFQGIYPELKIDVHIKICTQMFIASLILTDRKWK